MMIQHAAGWIECLMNVVKKNRVYEMLCVISLDEMKKQLVDTMEKDKSIFALIERLKKNVGDFAHIEIADYRDASLFMIGLSRKTNPFVKLITKYAVKHKKE
jgi:hypothetical protein